MDVSATPYVFSLVIGLVFLLLFLSILAIRGTQRGRNLLLISSAVILFFAFRTIFEVLRNSTIPLPDPTLPEYWGEPYGDIMSLRSWASMKAQIDAIIIFILSVSYTYVKSREWSLQAE